MELVQPSLGLVVWMVIIFGVLLLILKKFGWPVILKALKDREEQINKALSAAETAKEEVKNLQLKNQEVLSQAREERDAILRDARLASEKIIEVAHQKAALESDRIIETARQTINYEKLNAITELRNQVASLSIEIAEVILKHDLQDKSGAERIIKEQIEKMSAN